MSWILLYGHIHLLGSNLIQFPLILFDSLLFLLCELGQVLFGTFGEAIADFYVCYPAHHLVLVDFRLKVEEDGKEEFFLGVDELLVEAEALDFGEVDVAVFGGDVVGRKTYNGLFLFVVESVEDYGSLSGIDH